VFSKRLSITRSCSGCQYAVYDWLFQYLMLIAKLLDNCHKAPLLWCRFKIEVHHLEDLWFLLIHTARLRLLVQTEAGSFVISCHNCAMQSWLRKASPQLCAAQRRLLSDLKRPAAFSATSPHVSFPPCAVSVPSPNSIDDKLLTIKKTDKPKPLVPNDKLVFGRTFADHMLEIDWDHKKGWHAPVIR
jgi:hypothetical protein